MSQARNANITTETRKQIDQLNALGWYHSIELPDGEVIQGLQSVELMKTRLARFPIPDNLSGKRALDIGAWDGWFSFELERRGAQVVALDSTRNPKLLLARDLLGSKVEYVVGDITHLTSKDLGRFDLVLFMGVLYHLKHPLLALENVCEMTDELACVESYVIDDGRDLTTPPVLEFYEARELRGQFDNWCGPNTACLLAMTRAAGFASVELGSVVEQRAHVTARRKWPVWAPGQAPEPLLLCVENSLSHDHSFHSDTDDYVSLWFQSAGQTLDCDNVCVEIGPFAARPVDLAAVGSDGWLATCKLPPGLAAGWHAIRLRVPGSPFSNPIQIALDLSPEQRADMTTMPRSQDLEVALVTDGKTWERGRVKAGNGSCLSLWARGIADDFALDQISVRLEAANLAAVFLSATDADGRKQVNAMVPSGIPPGKTSLALICNGFISAPVEIELIA